MRCAACGGLLGPLPHAGGGRGQLVPQPEGGEDGGVRRGEEWMGQKSPSFISYFVSSNPAILFGCEIPIYITVILCVLKQ